MAVSTGVEGLDRILGGGLPDTSTVLVSGSPGTGKTTIAMNFLQEGLRQGEECTFISTEQTFEQLEDNFEPFSFDLDDDRLTITSLHPRPEDATDELTEGAIVETYGRDARDSSEGSGYILRTLDRSKEIDRYRVDFSASSVREYVKSQPLGDRVVLDSVSGLQCVGDSPESYRRLALDLVQLINDRYESTALFTAERATPHVSDRPTSPSTGTVPPSTNPLDYNLHGVVQLHRRQIRGTPRQFIKVLKMRGREYDPREYELVFTDGGVSIRPEKRTFDSASLLYDHVPTGIEGLDRLLGGGLSRGESVLLQHDGRADVDPILYILLARLMDREYSIAILPDPDSEPSLVRTIFDRFGTSATEALDSNRLFVLDTRRRWGEHPNVFSCGDGSKDMLEGIVEEIRTRTDDRGIVFAVNAGSLSRLLGDEAARTFRSLLQTDLSTSEDLVIDVQNLGSSDDTTTFYAELASQVLNVWMDETSLQYVQLRKNPTDNVGAVRLVEFSDERPHLRVVS